MNSYFYSGIPVLLFIAYGIYWIFDGYFLPVLTGQVTISKKVHADPQAYSHTTYNNYSVPYTDSGTIPETFSLEFIVNGKESGAFVSKEIFDSSNVGSIVSIRYTTNRFTRRIKVLGVTP